MRVEVQPSAGGTHTQAIRVTNTGKEAVRVRVSVLDWDLSRDGAPQFHEVEEGRAYSASGWIRVAPPEVTIDPRTDGTVRFSMAVPPGIPHAGYRTAIMFEMAPAAGSPVARRHEVALRSRIATLIYAHVGEPPVAIDLTDLRSRTTPEGVAVVATLKSTGRRSVRTRGTMTITGAGGAVVHLVQVPEVPVLPESERDVVVVVSEKGGKALPPGEYRVEVKIDVGLPALIVGETTLKVAK